MRSKNEFVVAGNKRTHGYDMTQKRQLLFWPRVDEERSNWEDARSSGERSGGSPDEGSEPESDAYYFQAETSKYHSCIVLVRREKKEGRTVFGRTQRWKS